MSGNRWFDRIIAILALIVSCIAAYYAYLSYSHDLESDKRPDLAIYFSINENEVETQANSMKIDLTKVKRDKDIIEFDLPLLVKNNSEIDANKIVMWVGVKTGDLSQIDLLATECDWVIGKKSEKGKWITGKYEHLPPTTQVSLKGCNKIRVKEGIKEIKLSWEILASRFLPKK